MLSSGGLLGQHFWCHFFLFVFILLCWKHHSVTGILAILILVLFCTLIRGPSQTEGMGCVKSKEEPLICQKDLAEFLTRWQRRSDTSFDQSVHSSQSSSDYSLLKIEDKSTYSQGAGSGMMECPTSWVTEVPELIGVALVALIAMVWIRRWNRRQYLKQYRRAMGLGIGIQSISSGIPLQPRQGQLTQEGSYKSWVGRNLD